MQNQKLSAILAELQRTQRSLFQKEDMLLEAIRVDGADLPALRTDVIATGLLVVATLEKLRQAIQESRAAMANDVGP